MTAEEYLVNRIAELEQELKSSRNECYSVKYGQRKLQEEMSFLNKKIEQYQIEHEHIKEIIICSINLDGDLVLLNYENDLKTLLSILDIKPEDYSESQKEPVYEFDDTKPNCDACIHKKISLLDNICFSCGPQYRNFERRTEDAENTD